MSQNLYIHYIILALPSFAALDPTQADLIKFAWTKRQLYFLTIWISYLDFTIFYLILNHFLFLPEVLFHVSGFDISVSFFHFFHFFQFALSSNY